MLDPDAALTTAIAAAKAAGKIIVDRHGTELDVQTKSSARDLVTEVDRQAQEVIIQTIQKEYPDHRFIAEEDTPSLPSPFYPTSQGSEGQAGELRGARGADELGDKDSPYVWIIDPIDGTTNFVHGKKECGTLIALQQDGKFIVAVMYEPFIKRLYTGIKGQGAFCNGEKCTVRNTRDLDDAQLSSNIRKRAIKDKNGVLQVAIPNCGGLLNYGCALTEFGDIIRGYNDGLFFDGVGLWDVAAGCLLVEEAGGKCRYELLDSENPRKGVKCVASTAPIFDELCEFLWN